MKALRCICLGSTIIISFLISGCNSNEPAIISNQKISLQLWSNWKFTELQGIDSYVGVFSDGNEEISFDYGIFAFGNLSSIEQTEETIYYEETIINGVPAKITKENREDGISLNLYVDKGDEVNLVWLYVYNPSDDQKFITIFKSLQFL